MIIQTKNLYYPIMYMLRRMQRKEASGDNSGKPIDTCCTCLDALVPIDLIREDGRLKKVVGKDNGKVVWSVELFYNGAFLHQVLGSCPNCYQELYTLEYDGGILVHVDVEISENGGLHPNGSTSCSSGTSGTGTNVGGTPYQPAKTIDEAEEWVKNNFPGIVPNYDAGPIEAANYYNEALQFLQDNCPAAIEAMQKNGTSLLIDDTLPNGTNGYFSPGNNEIGLNSNIDWDNVAELQEQAYNSGSKSTGNKLRIVIHEVGHATNYYNLGTDGWNDMTSMDPDGYGPKHPPGTKTERDLIESEVSSYGTKFYPVEAQAEIFAGKVTGHTYSNDVMNIYNKHGGFQC